MATNKALSPCTVIKLQKKKKDACCKTPHWQEPEPQAHSRTAGGSQMRVRLDREANTPRNDRNTRAFLPLAPYNAFGWRRCHPPHVKTGLSQHLSAHAQARGSHSCHSEISTSSSREWPRLQMCLHAPSWWGHRSVSLSGVPPCRQVGRFLSAWGCGKLPLSRDHSIVPRRFPAGVFHLQLLRWG